jgi:hypothetical protein
MTCGDDEHSCKFRRFFGGPEGRIRFFKIIISLFIVVHVGLTIAFLSPENIAFRRAITDASEGAWKFAGLWQGWALFAPEIRHSNSHCIALLTFADGSSTQWPLPRFDQMNLLEKYQKDKFRKWSGDNAPWDRYSEFWPGLARYIGRLHFQDGNRPVSCTLLMYSSDIPEPGTPGNRLPMPHRSKASLVFYYRYNAEDFSV